MRIEATAQALPTTATDRGRAKSWELGATTEMCRIWLEQRRYLDARDLLAPIYGWFEEGHDTSVLADAGALLEELT